MHAADGTGRNIFRGTISLKIFLFFTGNPFLSPWKSGDKAAAINDIACNNYTYSQNARVDEMLTGFRADAMWESKHRKYLIKIFNR